MPVVTRDTRTAVGNLSTERCPVCEGKEFQTYRELVSELAEVPDGLDRAQTVRVRIERCRGCGLYRTAQEADGCSPQALYEDASVCYEASVSKVRRASIEPVLSVDELSLLGVKPPARLLDIGCGAGQLLLRAARAGYQVSGIDLDPRAILFAREELGLDVRRASLDHLSADETFDVVTMMGVLEHIADPRSFLLDVRKRIHPGGEIMVGVPNVASLNRHISRLSRHDWDMFLEPGHLYHYGINTLTKLAEQTGLRLRRWVSGTIAIRGKVPVLPVRRVGLERALQRAVTSNRGVRLTYVACLRALDLFRGGDVLLATFGYDG